MVSKIFSINSCNFSAVPSPVAQMVMMACGFDWNQVYRHQNYSHHNRGNLSRNRKYYRVPYRECWIANCFNNSCGGDHINRANRNTSTFRNDRAKLVREPISTRRSRPRPISISFARSVNLSSTIFGLIKRHIDSFHESFTE